MGTAPLPSDLRITVDALPGGVKNEPYNLVLTASGGTLPYTWSRIAGALPPGVVLESQGLLTGVPTSSGTFGVTLQVTDASVGTSSRAYSLVVAAHPALAVLTELVARGASRQALRGRPGGGGRDEALHVVPRGGEPARGDLPPRERRPRRHSGGGAGAGPLHRARPGLPRRRRLAEPSAQGGGRSGRRVGPARQEHAHREPDRDRPRRLEPCLRLHPEHRRGVREHERRRLLARDLDQQQPQQLCQLPAGQPFVHGLGGRGSRDLPLRPRGGPLGPEELLRFGHRLRRRGGDLPWRGRPVERRRRDLDEPGLGLREQLPERLPIEPQLPLRHQRGHLPDGRRRGQLGRREQPHRRGLGHPGQPGGPLRRGEGQRRCLSDAGRWPELGDLDPAVLGDLPRAVVHRAVARPRGTTKGLFKSSDHGRTFREGASRG